jgi:hypothetical protein
MWANYRASGAQRLILCRILQARSLLRSVVQAVLGAAIQVVRLLVGLETVHARIRGIRARETGRNPVWYLDATAYFDEGPTCAIRGW